MRYINLRFTYLLTYLLTYCVPLGRGSWVCTSHNVAGAEAYLLAKFHFVPSNRLATTHQRYRQDR